MAGIGHRGFMGRKKGRDCSSYLPGLYSVSELDQMIFVDGYIPVANATEFDNIRTGSAETMGAGTCWEDTYMTGGDKKYVQVLDIDFDNFGTWDTPLPCTNGFVYDGNFSGDNGAVVIKNLYQEDSLFDKMGNSIQLINILAHGEYVSTSNRGAILTFNNGLTYPLQNIHYVGDLMFNMSIKQRVGGMFGDGTSSSKEEDVINCSFNGNATVSGTTERFGVMVGTRASSFLDCIVYGVVTALDTDYVGAILGAGGVNEISEFINVINYAVVNGKGAAGIMGLQGNITVFYECYNYGEINGTTNVGGIVGSGGGTLVKCVNQAEINGTTNVGGIVGSGGNNIVIEKCVNFNKVNSNALSGRVNIGGIAGTVTGVGTLIKTCANYGDVYTNGTHVGGIIGTSNAVIQDCYVECDVQGSANVGGIYGLNGTGGVVQKSLAIVTSALQGVSGNNAGTVTDTYWDTTIGSPTSFKGTGYSTVDLQTPTSNTGIYANYDPAIWDFGTSSEYPKLINTP